MTSGYHIWRRLWVVALLLVAESGLGAEGAARDALLGYIRTVPELHAHFAKAPVSAAEPGRAEAWVAENGQRRAVILVRGPQSRRGRVYCHEALSRPEQAQWHQRLRRHLGSDEPAVREFAAKRPVRVSFRLAEYAFLRADQHWYIGLCAVPEDRIIVDYPPLPTTESSS